ncbi:M56 family metallopeptidase [Xylocopilactobacillus apicola]|uniref:Peptidase M56 domain-containing protein n=1 Tax=Xylocopilactobacillus apicola TaxID=2932184 RepID=A0AAU9DAZ1_9LACO|nr:M56 family metallopeptidase [Xylocopilactobacillus apicola]BDR58735.1 hypothetical protein XA3_11760 [Xylocopilactobacillus apicola]
MQLTISSIIMSLIVFGIFDWIFRLFMNKNRFYRKYTLFFLDVLSFLMVAKLCFPFEFKFTKTIESENVYAFFYSIGRSYPKNSPGKFNVGFYLEIIWLIGSVIFLSIFLFNNLDIFRRLRRLNPLPEKYLSPKVKGMIPANVKLYYLPTNDSPFNYGFFKQKIFLTDLNLTEEEYKFVIEHELAHIRRRDGLRQFIVGLLVCIYWWFLPIYWFQKRIYKLHDLNADFGVVKNKNLEECESYIDCLTKITSLLKKERAINYKFHYTYFASVEKSSFDQRVSFLIKSYKNRNSSNFMNLLLLSIVIFMNLFIIEPSYPNPKCAEGTFEINPKDPETYVLKKDNKYYLIIDDKNICPLVNFPRTTDENLKQLSVRER